MHGTRAGLSLILKFPDNDQPLSTSVYGASLKMGFKVHIHSNIEFPTKETLGKLAAVNNLILIGVRPTETVCSDQVRQLAIEDRMCVFPEERSSSFFPQYSEINCQVECRMKKMYEICGCMPYTFFPRDNISVCNFKKIPCIVDKWGEFLYFLLFPFTNM